MSTLAETRSIVNAWTNEDGKITEIENQNITNQPPSPF